MIQLPKEPPTGPIEYKTELVNLGPERVEELATQLKFRLEEGGGEAFYFIGVSDDGRPVGLTQERLEESVRNLERIVEFVGAKIVDKRVEKIDEGKYVGELLIRLQRDASPIEVNLAVLGHVNAGKSTLTGALITGKLDDGNGMLRSQVARYLHEVMSGRTSSITIRLLGFGSSYLPTNWNLRDPLDEAEVTLKSNKILRLIDLGGHERYLRTTLKGLVGYYIDYAMLVVGSDDGLLTMGREHLALASVLKIPLFIVVTKVDKSRERANEVVDEIKRILKLPGINKIGYEVKNEHDIVTSVIAMKTERVVPIFRVSNVTGEGLNLLLKFLNSLPPRRRNVEGDALAYVDDIFTVSGVGTVILVTVTRGQFRAGEEAYIGPMGDGSFASIKIKSVQVNRVFVDSARAGNVATFAIQGINREVLRKGMAVVKKPSRGTRRFKARVMILHHPTTIRRGYVATVHVNTIRQAARFVELEKDYLRTGDISTATLEFLYRPEYLENGTVFVFREGRTRGMGIILETL